MDAVADDLGGDRAGEHVERGLRGEVGREAGSTGQDAERRDVDDVAVAAPAHAGQEREHEPHRGEVVEVDRDLEVARALVGVRDPAPDRVPRVVDEDVDPVVGREDLLGHALDVGRVGQVRGVDGGRPAVGSNPVGDLLELRAAPGHEDDLAAGLGDPLGGAAPDAARCAGHDHALAGDRLGQRPLSGVRQTQRALPVGDRGIRVDDERRQAFERVGGHRDILALRTGATAPPS